jgi:hypothetical protein
MVFGFGKKFKCDKCGEKFKSEDELHEHVMKTHPMPAMAPSAPKVLLTMENIDKCNCKMCPMQAKSTCAQGLQAKMMEMKKSMMEGKMTMMTPMPEAVPGVYCSSGKAICKDLDFTKTCICPTCPVFKEHNLIAGTPVGYFCRDGRAV